MKVSTVAKAERRADQMKKRPYRCPVCGLTMWGGHGKRIKCLDCDAVMIEHFYDSGKGEWVPVGERRCR